MSYFIISMYNKDVIVLFKFVKLTKKEKIWSKVSCLMVLIVLIVFGASNDNGYTSVKSVRNYVADNTLTIKFNQAQGKYVIATCNTNANGNVSADCASCVASVCNGWHHDLGISDPGLREMNGSQIATYPFNNYSYTNYYCVSGTSNPDNESRVCDACYVCKDNENIKKWSADGTMADASCPAGYIKNTNISESDCVTKTPSCYVCDNDEHVMSWGYSSDEIKASDNGACKGSYKEDSSINQSMCVTTKPSCYVCDSDNHVMSWGYSSDEIKASDNGACKGSYKEDASINQSMCVTTKPSCYVCDSDNHVMSWGYSSDEIKASDNGTCSGNYNKNESIDESMCVTTRPSCYVCDSDNHIMSWGYSSDEIKASDNGACSGNYNRDESIGELFCRTIDIPEENIDTGSLSIYIVFSVIAGVTILAVGSYYYLIKYNNKKTM